MKSIILSLMLAVGSFAADRTPEQKLVQRIRQELVTLPFYSVFDR